MNSMNFLKYVSHEVVLNFVENCFGGLTQSLVIKVLRRELVEGSELFNVIFSRGSFIRVSIR